MLLDGWPAPKRTLRNSERGDLRHQGFCVSPVGLPATLELGRAAGRMAAMAPRPRTYVRFVCYQLVENQRQRPGLFQALDEARESDFAPPWALKELGETYDWFKKKPCRSQAVFKRRVEGTRSAGALLVQACCGKSHSPDARAKACAGGMWSSRRHTYHARPRGDHLAGPASSCR